MPNINPALPDAGKSAPAFNLPASNQKNIRLSTLKGQWVVLYFYLKDDTPGCTIEAKEFRDAIAAYNKLNTVILGISPDPVEKHCKFIDKHDLDFILLSDADHAIAEKYGVWVEKNLYGRKYMGIQRATFLIDPKGKIQHVWPKVKPKGHAQQILDVLAEL